MAKFPRSSGILLHPTSLPGRYGIGDLGESAYRFVDALEAAGQTIWQVLPLNPTGYADSPYQSLSTFAGNTNLINLDKLVEVGWLTGGDVADVPDFPLNRVDYGPMIEYHNRVLALAHDGFLARGTDEQKQALETWCQSNVSWLDDFALFTALKESYDLRPWVEWPEEEAQRDPQALAAAREKHAKRIEEHRFLQWVFSWQWKDLRGYANRKGIRIVGDTPIFVAHDSSDVWANPDLFYLDEQGNPVFVAGVPPDYFSATGQYWGNPLYRWDRMKPAYNWWMDRVLAALSLVDMVRIDHFRGFEAYWEIPRNEDRTAVKGRWVKGPDADFFNKLAATVRTLLGKELNEVIIAEDLGVITRPVLALRDGFTLPGMNILQFAFVNEGRFLPHNHSINSIVYTGTHDNNTTVGWWNGESTYEEREFMKRYLGRPDIAEPSWELIRLGMMSVAHTFVMPMQDLLGLGAEARMNTPGTTVDNWQWRLLPEQLNDNGWRERLAGMTRLFERWPKPAGQEEQMAEVEVEMA